MAINHKRILLYGHVFYDHGRKRFPSFKDVFGEISRLRSAYKSARDTIDSYVNLILYGADSEWKGTIRSAGKSYCREYLKHNKSIMLVPDPDENSKTEGKGQVDILSDLLILSAADDYFRKAWESYQTILEKKLPDFFDLLSADRYRRELGGVAGQKTANDLFLLMWHVYYGQSFIQVFHEGFFNVILEIALDNDNETDKLAWQILLENFNQ